MKNIIFIFLICTLFPCFGQQNCTIKEYQANYTTYPYSDPNPIPAPRSDIYPYFQFSGYTSKAMHKEWRVVELENDFIKVLIFPELGGKVWTAIEKSTGRPYIYYNHVVKFRNIAARGPYTSGGIEFNFGTFGHASSTSAPVDYATNYNPDGSVSCTFGTLDMATMTDWRVEVNLPKDKAFFTTKTFWYGNSPIEEPYYQWHNAAFPSEGNLEFLFSGTGWIGHNGEYGDWPVNKSNGKNISFYEENDFGIYKSYHVIGKHTYFYGTYWHDNDFGMIHYAPRDAKAGQKIWIWGLSGQGMIWEKLLTDNDGQYVELQSGRLFNQNSSESSLTPFKHRGFFPFATDVWTEYWYPILQTDGAVEANEYGALNMDYRNGWLIIYFCPVQNIDEIFVIKNDSQTIYQKKIQLKPLQVFIDSIRTGAPEAAWSAVLGKQKLIYSFDPGAKVLQRPYEAPENFDWTGEYGLTLAARELMDQKMYDQAEGKLKEALKLNPDYVPALVKMTQLRYRRMQHDEALKLIRHALSIDGLAGDVNYYYGLVNAKLGNIIDARDGFELATLSAEYRSAAYTQLGLLSLKGKEMDKVIYYAQKALDNNRYNIAALKLEAVAYRCQNNISGAGEVLETIKSFDPLNHFVNFENYLLNPDAANKDRFIGQIRNEFPAITIEELGIWYYNAGCLDEARKVFAFFPDSPVPAYWMSYLTKVPVDFSGLNPSFVFPQREETGEVIAQLLTWQNHWMLKYHLALLYAAKRQYDRSNALIFDCGDEPGFAPFYAYRASLQNNAEARLADIRRAISLDPDLRYKKMLIESSGPSEALKLAGNFYKKNPNQTEISMVYIRLLMNDRKYEQAEKILAGENFIPMEASTQGRDLYREVKLMKAIECMAGKKYNTAIKFIQEAKLYPESLGSGKPYQDFVDERLEDWMTYLCCTRLNQEEQAEAALNKVLAYKPPLTSYVDNYTPANELITAWAYDIKKEHTKATDWISNVHKNKEKVAELYNDVREGRKPDFAGIESNIRIMERLVELNIADFPR